MEKTAVFIDAEYLLQSLRALWGKPRNVLIRKEDFLWNKFVRFILDEKKASEVFYYTARLDAEENQKTFDAQTKFFEQIERELRPFGLKMRLGKMIKIRNKIGGTWNEHFQNSPSKQRNSWGQKGIDTKIILDMCRFAYEKKDDDKCKTILVSGDEDFAEALTLLREKGVTTKLVAFNRISNKVSDSLKESADSFTILDYDILRRNSLI